MYLADTSLARVFNGFEACARHAGREARQQALSPNIIQQLMPTDN